MRREHREYGASVETEVNKNKSNRKTKKRRREHKEKHFVCESLSGMKI